MSCGLIATKNRVASRCLSSIIEFSCLRVTVNHSGGPIDDPPNRARKERRELPHSKAHKARCYASLLGTQAGDRLEAGREHVLGVD